MSPRFRPGRILAPVLAGAVLCLVLVLIYLYPPALLTFLDNKIYDIFLRSGPRPPTTGRVVVVDLDEESLSRYGQWPWPRYRTAMLLEKVRALGAAGIGLDITFPEQDRTSLLLLRRDILRDLAVDISPDSPAGGQVDNDLVMAETLGRGPYVLGYQFLFEGGSATGRACLLHPLTSAALDGDGRSSGGFFRPAGAVCNLDVFSRAVSSSGFFNVTPDADGLLRRVPLVMEYLGQLYPSLALAAVIRYLGGQQAVFRTLPSGGRELWLGERRIPLDERGNMLIRFRGRGRTFTYLSAAAVMGDTAPAGSLEGKVVFIGTSAAGLKETRATPLDPAHPGPEIHATVADNILAGDILSRPAWGRVAELALVLAACAAAALFLVRSGALWGLPFAAAAAVCLWLASRWLFSGRLVYLSPLYPTVSLALTYTLAVTLSFRRAQREVWERTRKLALTQDVIIQSMASLAETRDNETGGHIQRTRHYMLILAEGLKDHPRFRKLLDRGTIEMLYKLAPLHDVGKVGVRDNVLLKPERLTLDEFEEMKKHTIYGSDAILRAEEQLGEESFLELARQIALTHQEKWDGTGYPNRLKGEEIPIPGRLMAVADVYDALISRRKYKDPMPHEEAVKIMAEGRGTHFDPDVLDVFLARREEFRRIAELFAEDGGPPPPEARVKP